MEQNKILYGVALLAIIPVRQNAAEQSEMVTQLLFGDSFEILEQESAWCKIKNDYDNYEGWVSRNMIAPLSAEEYEEYRNSLCVTNCLNTTVYDKNELPTNIPLGGSIKEIKSGRFQIGKSLFHIKQDLHVVETKNRREKCAIFAKMYLNTPYLWGGRSPYGIDCSGFSQIVGKLIGIKLPRDASQQVTHGQTVNFLKDAKCGDLAFFDNEEGNITHVGILLPENTIIHASGKVRIDAIDQQGIFNKEINRYTHKLRIIKDIIE